jgi:hypothetical protein
MTPFMRAYEAGRQLAKLASLSKLAEGMPDSLDDNYAREQQHTIDRGIENIQRARRIQELSTGGNRSFDLYQDDRFPAYVGDTRAMSSVMVDNPRVGRGRREFLKANDKDVIELRSGYAPGAVALADADKAERDLRHEDKKYFSDYINPLSLAIQHGRAQGMGQAEADAYAAMQDYDMYDVADFYNSLADEKGDLNSRHAKSHKTPARDRLRMFAGSRNVAPLAPEVREELPRDLSPRKPTPPEKNPQAMPRFYRPKF